MTAELTKFIHRLSDAQTVAAAWEEALAHFRGEGLPWLSYGYKECTPSGTLLDALSNLPKGLQERWRGARLYERDPMIEHVTSSMVPAVIGIDYLVNREPEIVDHYRRMSRAGARSSYVMALRCITRSAPGYFLAGGPQDSIAFDSLVARAGERLSLAVFYADLRLQELFHRQMLAGVRLTLRERQCLELLSSGLKNERIAAELGVSEVTVRLHFTNARQKLRTATREQALARATMLGLINPMNG